MILAAIIKEIGLLLKGKLQEKMYLKLRGSVKHLRFR